MKFVNVRLAFVVVVVNLRSLTSSSRYHSETLLPSSLFQSLAVIGTLFLSPPI